MTAILQSVVVDGGGGSGASVPADNSRGSVIGLAPSAIATLVEFTAGVRRLRGFYGYGSTDGLFWIEVDGTPLPGMIARHSRVQDAARILPNAESYASPGSIVSVKVLNEAAIAGDFEVSLLGE